MAYEDDRELKLAIIRAVAAHQLVSDKVLKSFTLQWTKDLTIEGMTLTYKPLPRRKSGGMIAHSITEETE
jgi:hypothetical protein